MLLSVPSLPSLADVNTWLLFRGGIIIIISSSIEESEGTKRYVGGERGDETPNDFKRIPPTDSRECETREQQFCSTQCGRCPLPLAPFLTFAAIEHSVRVPFLCACKSGGKCEGCPPAARRPPGGKSHISRMGSLPLSFNSLYIVFSR